MRKLWIHIGSHKTATTSIQGALSDAQKTGNLQGLKYPLPNPKTKKQLLVSTKGDGASCQSSLNWKVLRESVAGTASTILSAEGLFWLHDANTIAQFAKELQPQFDAIHVVAYLRRQDQLALSHRKQVVKRPAAARFYGVEATALPSYAPHFDRYFDYATKMDTWADAFGAAAMTVRLYDRATLKDGDAVTDFFDLIGQTPGEIGKDRNQPLSRRQLLAGLFLKSQGIKPKVINRIIENFPPDVPLQPSRQQAEDFLAHFADSNRKLAKTWGTPDRPGFFDTDMSMYPEVGNDTLELAGLNPKVLLRRAKRQPL